MSVPARKLLSATISWFPQNTKTVSLVYLSSCYPVRRIDCNAAEWED